MSAAFIVILTCRDSSAVQFYGCVKIESTRGISFQRGTRNQFHSVYENPGSQQQQDKFLISRNTLRLITEQRKALYFRNMYNEHYNRPVRSFERT
jgi:hypothetical protein